MCVFCDIINNKIPSFKIYEDEFVTAFLDISQATKGHSIIVTKRHVENVFDLSDKESKSIMIAAVKISNLLKTKLGANNINLLNNSGPIAGQTVMHFHLHVIPRYSDDDGVSFRFTEHSPNFDCLKKTNEELKK